MFNRAHLNRQNQYGMTTLELHGPNSVLQLKFISRGDKRERRAFVRSFLAQIRPWLKYFKEPVINHSGRGFIREKPVGRSRINIFQSSPISTLSGSLGYEIRKKRIELGLTQSELAQMLAIQRSHLSDIERGIHLPNPKTRLAIGCALKLSFG